MPQMSPLWWEILFLTFMTTYMMVNIMIYFMTKKSLPIKNNKELKINQKNWKW